MFEKMILDEINNGNVDESLDKIQAAVIARRKAVTAVDVAGVKLGSIVRLTTSIRPKYLAGQKGEVIKVMPSGKFGVQVIHDDPWMAVKVSVKPELIAEVVA